MLSSALLVGRRGHGDKRLWALPSQHCLSHVATCPQRPAAHLLLRGPHAEADAWSQASARHGAGSRDRQHFQIQHHLGQASLGTGRKRDNHPPQPPYLGVVRPTVMDIIETPKIDRLHRLGAVSLKVRAGWGGRRWEQVTVGTSSPHCPGRSCPPLKQATSHSQRMQ